MLVGLTTGHEIGLAGTGAAFIVFSLLSSFVFPRRDPNFPGQKGLRWYLPLAGLFFVAMMSSVVVFGREQAEAHKIRAERAPLPPKTTTSTAPTGGGKLTSGPYANGDAAAGKSLFSSNGCTGCHTLKAAGSTGTVGPSLDDLPQAAAKAGQPLGAFIAESIDNPDAYIAPGYSKGLMPPFGKSLTSKQIADLTAFVYDSVRGGG